MARRLTKEQIISNTYYDNEGGFGSIQETYNKAKAQTPEITLDDVKQFMRKQPNKQIKGYRGSNSYTAPFARFVPNRYYGNGTAFKEPRSQNRTNQKGTKVCLSGH